MDKILRVAKREYLETVKTKAFVIGILMVPAIIVGIIFFTSRIMDDKGQARPPLRVVVTDHTADLVEQVREAFAKHNEMHEGAQVHIQWLDPTEDPNEAERQGKDRVRKGSADGYAVLERGVLGGQGKIRMYTSDPKPSLLDALQTAEGILNRTVVSRRCEIEKIDPELLRKLRYVSVEHIELGESEEAEKVQSEAQRVIRFMTPFVFMWLIFMGLMSTGQQMISSVIEEKSSRVIEVLLSALSPFELMAGKIVGLGAIGLTVMGLWAAAAIGTARWRGMNVDVPPDLVAYFVVYYVLGFLLITAVFAAAGSVCNTLKETQSLMMPVTLCFILPMISWFKIVQNPNGLFARVTSFIPPLTPMVMILRISATSDISFIEVIGSILLLAASVVGAMWVAAKVFRTGILMYGKRPGFREILRWLRQS